MSLAVRRSRGLPVEIIPPILTGAPQGPGSVVPFAPPLIRGQGPRTTEDLVDRAVALRAQWPQTYAETPEFGAILTELRTRWISPLWLLADIARRLHVPLPFDLDLCAEERTSAGKVYFGPGSLIGEDGLTSEVPAKTKSIYCNPPWSNAGPWVERVIELFLRRRILAVLTLPSYTDNEWWAKLVALERAKRAVRWEIIGRVNYDLHPSVVAAGLIKPTSASTERTTVWVLNPRRRNRWVDLTPIDARGRTSPSRVAPQQLVLLG